MLWLINDAQSLVDQFLRASCLAVQAVSAPLESQLLRPINELCRFLFKSGAAIDYDIFHQSEQLAN